MATSNQRAPVVSAAWNSSFKEFPQDPPEFIVVRRLDLGGGTIDEDAVAFRRDVDQVKVQSFTGRQSRHVHRTTGNECCWRSEVRSRPRAVRRMAGNEARSGKTVLRTRSQSSTRVGCESLTDAGQSDWIRLATAVFVGTGKRSALNGESRHRLWDRESMTHRVRSACKFFVRENSKSRRIPIVGNRPTYH